jgi:hypothetical protein
MLVYLTSQGFRKALGSGHAQHRSSASIRGRHDPTGGRAWHIERAIRAEIICRLYSKTGGVSAELLSSRTASKSNLKASFVGGGKHNFAAFRRRQHHRIGLAKGATVLHCYPPRDDTFIKSLSTRDRQFRLAHADTGCKMNAPLRRCRLEESAILIALHCENPTSLGFEAE